MHCSPIGIIPKPHQPGKFRLIVDLSAPKGSSVNDFIPPELCSLEYASIDDAAKIVTQCGEGALMAKLDLKSAYRMVPVHPADQALLGIRWEGKTFIDHALPFGLRSAPKIFNAVADGLTWALLYSGVDPVLHYLDDFFFCSAAHSPACKDNLAMAVATSDHLGLPVAPHKVEGPTTTLTFLGIEIDSTKRELRLPQAKLARTENLLQSWEGRRTATKHELQCLIGHLNHAAKVVRPGRTFLRELIRTMSIPKHSYHKVRLNLLCRADIAWWALFISQWNGVSLFPTSLPRGPSVVSDASGTWGCGAFTGDHLPIWFHLPWPPSGWEGKNIAVKEMIPMVISAGIWGKQWRGRTVEFRSDNMAVVHALSKGAAREPHLAHLLCCLSFLEATFGFEHRVSHIPGKLNMGADALSRNNVLTLSSLFPQAPSSSAPVPAPLLELLFNNSLSWISPTWKSLFQDFLATV